MTAPDAAKLIRSELHKRYPGGLAPYGAWTELATLFGISRARVQSIAQAEGMHIVHLERPARTRHCKSCGSALSPADGRSRYCRDHQSSTLVCTGCGSAFERSPRVYRHTLRPFCSRSCYYTHRRDFKIPSANAGSGLNTALILSVPMVWGEPEAYEADRLPTLDEKTDWTE